MRVSHTVSFIKLESLSVQDLPVLSQALISASYTEEEGYGFSEINLINEQTLTAKLLKRTPTTIPQFDLNSREFIETQIFIFNEISFAIDLQYQTLNVFGPTKNVPKVRSALFALLPSHVSVSHVQFLPAKLLPQLEGEFDDFNIEHLIVNNFQYGEGIVGKYIIKEAERLPAQAIIKIYAHDVIEISLSLNDAKFDNFLITISHRGTLKIRCSEDSFTDLLNTVKSILFTKE